MSSTEDIRDIMKPLERDYACACGATIRQKGYAGVSGKGAFWSPARCQVCAVKYLEDRKRDGIREAEEDATHHDVLDRQRTASRKAQALAALDVAPLYLGASLDTFQLHGTPDQQLIQTRAVTIGRRYCGDWPDISHSILILRGSYGTGKGHWAWSVAQWLVNEHAIQARVVKLSDLVRRLRRSWKGTGNETEEEALAFFRHLDLLVIDEVSRHAFYGENIHQHLYDVLDYRMEYRRPTVLTTNETDDGIRAVIRDALMDRVLGTGGVVDFGTASYRARTRSA